MSRKVSRKVISIIVAVCFLSNMVLADVALAKASVRETPKGKYYGQTLPAKNKVNNFDAKQKQSSH